MARPRHRTSPQETAAALGRVAPLVSRWIERLLAAHEPPLTLAQFLTLRAVAEGEVVGSELARRAAVSPAAVSQLLDALEAGGLVERLRTPDDRRRQPLVLTTKAKRVLDSAEALLRERLATLLAALPPPEVDALGRLLRHVEETLGGRAPPPRPPRRRPAKPKPRPR